MIDNEHASRRHCRIFWKQKIGWMVEDLASTNGTKLNGEDLIYPKLIYTGNELLIGTTCLKIKFIEPIVTDKLDQSLLKDVQSEDLNNQDTVQKIDLEKILNNNI